MAFTQISGDGLKNNSITNAHLHSGANIAASKLADSGVTAGSYGSASLIPAITVNAQGLVTSVSTNSFTTTDNNFTNALLSKLNGIAANANNYSLPTASSDTLGGIKVGTNLSISNGVLSATDTNTTYSVGDGGLTQKNFTTTLKDKLDGIAASANNYSFPYTISTDRSNGTVVRRADPGGYIYATYFNTTPNDIATGSITKICAESNDDGFIRHATAAAVRSFLNVADGATNNGSGSLSSYLPLSGGTVTGAVTVNGGDLRVDGGRNLRIGDGNDDERILIQKIANNISDHIIFYNGTTRVGEIGCEDNSWLRINQETAKNIYTPRMIRADAGFQVDGNYIANETGSLRVSANQDIGFANGTWSGNNTKIQLHSNYLYIVGGSNGIVFREGGTNRWFVDGSGHFVPNGNGNYNIGNSSNYVNNIYGNDIHANGGAGAVTIKDGSDIRFESGTWTGETTCKLQLHSNVLYLQAPAFLFRDDGGSNRWSISSSGHFIPSGSANYDVGDTSNLVRYVYSTRFYPNSTSRYITGVTGNYGSIEVKGANGGWAGYSIDGRVVFMHNGSTGSGIYNDVNNEWMITASLNSGVGLYYNASLKFETNANGSRFYGNLYGDDNREIRLGNSGDLQLYHDGSNSYVNDQGTGSLRLVTNELRINNSSNNELMIYAQQNSGIQLRYDNSTKLTTVNAGVSISGSCNPNSNNSRDLGASNLRWATLYIVNQPNVSDRNEKNTIQHSDLGLSFINKLNPVSFKWNDTSLGTKTRYGLIVQEVEEAVKELGKDPDDIGMIDKPKDGSMGLCTNELIAPLVKAIQELSAKVAALEAA